MAKRYILQQKVSEGTNRNMSARNTLVQLLLALYTDPESHNAQRYRQTDGHTYTVSQKNWATFIFTVTLANVDRFQ